MFEEFVKQSERVINVTHKPGPDEYKRIAISTGIGMLIIGVIGYVIAMAAVFMRRGSF
ncbi:protein translocase SEC61 complex subunit gamma [Candidatus Micrarchaeota archaeon]|nr:protein translocase SEC61 complex subunit gamma [Candidatus Micrarchaeota archaeon]